MWRTRKEVKGMPRKKRKAPKNGPVWKMSAEEVTLSKMPKFNAHACGTGAHGDVKYNRAKQKRAWQRELNRQETRNRGSLPFLGSIDCRSLARFGEGMLPYDSYMMLPILERSPGPSICVSQRNRSSASIVDNWRM